MSYRAVSKCRVCSGSDLTQVFDLGVQPLANDHRKPNETRQGFYPLAILFCNSCGLAQLSVVVNPETLYSSYSYTSSESDTMHRHYHRLFQDILSEEVERTIIEIGSNTGGLLHYAKKLGFKVLGIDPAKNLAEVSSRLEVPTIVQFFDRAVGYMANCQIPEPGVILARHCFAHMDDWHEFMVGIDAMARKDTLICIEFPSARDMLDQTSLDQTYHEHLSFISLAPLVKLLAPTPFHIHRVIRYSIHGGALLVMLRHNDSTVPIHLSAEEFLAEENITVQSWKEFSVAAHHKITILRDTVENLVVQGKVVSAFGASAKATVLLNACHFEKGDIAFCTDNSPLKPGCLIPGTNIPIIEESEMLSLHPDYSVLTCWNFRVECIAKTKKWRDRGGKFIIPAKQIEIV